MSTRTYRPIPLPLLALVALVSAVVALAVSGGHDAAAHGDATHATTTDVSGQELALRQGMNKLWEDHVTWTRLAVISLTTGSPDTDATVARLLRNQGDIGNAVKPFYGAKAGNALTGLLREHILIAADLIAAAKAGNSSKVTAEQTRWTANADEIAALLSSANPRFWKPAAMKAMMRHHLRLTTDEVLARLQGKWTADVRAYDRIHVQILHMSNMLSDGLVKQFPARFR